MTSHRAIYLAEPSFLASSRPVFHGFFTRHGGHSHGLYAALNCGPGSGEAMEIVQQNRALVAAEAGVAEVLSVHQVHGATCHIVTNGWPLTDRPEGDALATDKPGLGLGVLTADCAPVLFVGARADGAPVIGAAHAGWKGALGGVLEATLEKMRTLEAIPTGIRACIGPCIAKASYEVSAAFLTPFLEHDPESERFFHQGRDETRAYFDLPAYCAWRLQRAGLRHIALMDRDTYAAHKDFYSYRRATHAGQTEYGRQISVIAIPKT